MSDLSPRARLLLDRASGFGTPKPSDAIRVRHGVLAAVSAAASGAAAGGVFAGIVKVTAVFVVSASVGSGIVYLGHEALPHREPPAQHPALVRAAPAPRPRPAALPVPAPVEPPPAPAAPPPPSPPPAVAPAPKAKPPSLQPAVAAPPAAAPQPSTPPVPAQAPAPRPAAACDLGRELASVQRAQQQLEASPAEALRTLEQLDGVCAQGDLIPERRTLRALALCALGRTDEGLRERRWLEAHHPESPGLARVQLACPER